jgi:glyoxylase-like metal-dependent hydrolase (beta-lactamase superfamily II)
MIEIVPGLYVLQGAVNTGLLRKGDRALLFDCCDTVSPERLAELGVQRVQMILCTQHRRPNAGGAYPFVERGADLVVPEGERHLFEGVEHYWEDWRHRWHIYRHQPGPQVLPRSMKVARTVHEGDTICWEGWTIQVLDTPGATDGSVSYRVDMDGRVVCFCGDALYGPGQVWDLDALQKGSARTTDYHGFMGNRRKLVPSLQKLGACGAEILVPAHGAPMHDPPAATALTIAHLDAVWRNYTAISCLNHYFPGLLDEEVPGANAGAGPARMQPVATSEPPEWVRRVAYTSFALLSESGAALLIDCGHDSVVDTLQRWIQEGTITAVEGCWVTHYHDDHVDALQRAMTAFGCPIMTDQHMAEIVTHPTRFFLPCISPSSVPVARVTQDRASWQWHEFRLTPFHFPGQTFYHSGLLVEKQGQEKAFFAGDSGSPTGIDDHCCPNRNFLGKGRGFRRCFEIWRESRPQHIFNQHQERSFSFNAEELDFMDEMLAERERLLAELLPWAHPDFGTDEGWVRTYPFEQEVQAGGSTAIQVQFTNHGSNAVETEVEPVLPDGWTWDKGRSKPRVWAEGRSDGTTAPYAVRPDTAATIWFSVPEDTPVGRYVVPFRVTWGGRYLGQFRHAIVMVR